MKSRLLVTTAMTTAMLAVASVAIAQTDAAPDRSANARSSKATADSPQVDELIVTAQKRAQLLVDVPISITAYDANQLAARDITDLARLAFYAPGVEVTPSPGGGAGLTVRGVTTGVGGVGVDPSVGVYEDGVYVARDWVALQSYLDIDRVEVLRGPQGTLYGRNTTGGAYNLYHKLPTNDFEMGASAEFASYDKQRYEGFVSGPIINDRVLARFAVARETGDDYTKNLFTGRHATAADLIQGVGTIELRPTDSVTITLHGDAMNNNGRVGAGFHVVRPGTANATADLPTSPYEYQADFPGNDNYLRNRGWSADLAWDLGGGYQFKSITGGRYLRINTEYDTDSTELPIYTAVLNDKSNTISQEFQLSSPTGGRLDWIVGAFYYHESAKDLTTTGGPYQYGPFFLQDQAGNFLFSNSSGQYLSLNIPFNNRGLFDSQNRTTSYAGYGQANYKVTDKLSATLGLRYTTEKRTFSGTAGQTFSSLVGAGGLYNYDPVVACQALVAANPVSSPGGLTPEEAQTICVSNVTADIATYGTTTIQNRSDQTLNFNKLSTRFGLDYYPNENTHLYATATSGFKSGGFNSYDTDAAYSGSQPGNPGVPVIAFQPPFGPETLWSYEVGIKGSLFDKKLQYSLDYWYYDWSNIQSQIYNYTNRTSNITSDAKAKAQGIEIDMIAQPWPGGSVDFNGAWIDGEYTHFGSNIDDVVTGATNQDFTGTGLPGTPKWKWNLGVQQTWTAGTLGDLTLRGEYQHRSATFWVYTFDPLARSGDYDIFNLRLTYRDPSSKYSVGVYAENLFNQYYDYYRFGTSTTGVEAIVAPPRIIGVKISAKW